MSEINKAFSIEKNNDYALITLRGALVQSEGALEFDKRAQELVEAPILDTIVNCQNLSELSNPWIRSLLSAARGLKAQNKQIRLIQVSEKVRAFLRANGVDTALKICSGLRAALVDLGLATPKMLDVHFINPFLAATVNMLKVQAQVESKAGVPYKRQGTEKFAGDVSGVIGIVSDSFNGAVVISFPEETFLKVMSKMLGEPITTLTKEIADGAGEMTNIILGQAKVALNDKGHGIKTAIPSVITGKDHSISGVSQGPRVTIPFTTEFGPFAIEICLSE